MSFRAGALPYDAERHDGFYGARLIYKEVEDGFNGVVYDRQSGDGDREIVEARIFPHVDEAMELVRSLMRDWQLTSSSNDVVSIDCGDGVVFALSPQMSYGYLYLSAVVMK